MAGTGMSHLRTSDDVILSVRDLVVEFPLAKKRTVHAVSGISFDMRVGETVGLVGESGCGKSTTGRAVMHLPPPTSGRVEFEGVDITSLDSNELRRVRTRLQMIFQDPISSLNPRRRVRDVIAEGLDIWEVEGDRKAMVDEVLMQVGLDPELVGNRRPHEFSGGQCQRICIARALVMDPKIIICDEPVSALDVSIQAQILNLLEAMKARYGLSLLFIAHDLAVVKNISDRVVVMYLGKVCEVAPPDTLFASPRHPYTALLVESIPVPDPRHGRSERRITGELPSPVSPPSGCRFRTRCPRAQEICALQEPELTHLDDDHHVACHFPL